MKLKSLNSVQSAVLFVVCSCALFAFRDSAPTAAVLLGAVAAACFLTYLDIKTIRPTKSLLQLQEEHDRLRAEVDEMKNKISGLSIAQAAKPSFKRL